MNKKRRCQLRSAAQFLMQASSIVEGVLDEERECLENTPENLRESDRYTSMEEAIDNLEDAISSISEASGYIERASE